MKSSKEQIARLFSIRNMYGKKASSEKLQILNSILIKTSTNKKLLQDSYAALLFMIAYPDYKTVYNIANTLLKQLRDHIQKNEKAAYSLYNTGITGTSVCAAFSFEVVKWLRKTRPGDITLSSFEADDDKIQTVLSVVMPKTESEIFQDGNAEWKGWLKQLKKNEEDLLDQFISIFDSSDIRSGVKEELWNTIGLNVEINFSTHCCLPESLISPFYHRSLIRKEIKKQAPLVKPVRVKLSENEAEQIIDCSKMILVRHLREIDPTSFTDLKYVSYYQLPRGFSIALMGMVPEHRHPVDSYLSYTIFKNGLPVSYGGSWILFDSGRFGFNVFPDYRGGESKYMFELLLQLHSKVFNLKRFTVDPYQIGKDNSDGIHSGSFWIYYHAGFRPLQKEQRELAASEGAKILNNKKYRSPASVLKTLANSRQELIMQKSAVRFDVTDLSRAYAGILKEKFNGNRLKAEKDSAKKLAGILQIKNYQDDNINFVLKNWSLLLLSCEKELLQNSGLKKLLKKLFMMKPAAVDGAVRVPRGDGSACAL